MGLFVLLVEDNRDFASTIIDYLALEDIECDYAENGQTGLEYALNNQYDVVLLDINLPRVNGLDVCEAMRQQGNDTPVMMLTAKDTIEDKLTGFRAGTDDYLVKPFDTAELVARIRALSMRRSSQITVCRVADLEIDVSSKTATRNGVHLELSPASWRILECLMLASPQVVSRSRLERVIWGDSPPDSNALKVYVYRLRLKVDTPFSSSLIHTIPGQGFVIRENDDG